MDNAERFSGEGEGGGGGETDPSTSGLTVELTSNELNDAPREEAVFPRNKARFLFFPARPTSKARVGRVYRDRSAALSRVSIPRAPLATNSFLTKESQGEERKREIGKE